MGLTLTHDHVLIEYVAETTQGGLYMAPDVHATEHRKARVIACGPGELRPDGGRQPLSCKPGDLVLVGSRAGFAYGTSNRRIVYDARKDIVAVLESAPTEAEMLGHSGEQERCA